MRIWSDSFKDGEPMPDRLAVCKPNPNSHVEFTDNLSPHIAWADLPEGTKSLVLTCVDPDAPTSAEKVNKEGMTVPASLPRTNFVHWVLVDLDPAKGSLAEGEFCKGVTPHGKSGPAGVGGTRHGKNDYTMWFAADDNMKGTWFGYDGPAPPWNDELIHRYRFTLYALDRDAVMNALDGHILGEAAVTGTYTVNPALR
jgi:Raf kinase inhibitor-like YbhB/YbcL family protein